MLSLLGACGTLGLGFKNGVFDIIRGLVEQDEALFPGSNQPLLKNYTGVKSLDTQLAALVTFFAPVVDLNDAPLALFSLFGLGQFGAAWTLLVMESMRLGNRKRVVSLYVKPDC